MATFSIKSLLILFLLGIVSISVSSTQPDSESPTFTRHERTTARLSSYLSPFAKDTFATVRKRLEERGRGYLSTFRFVYPPEDDDGSSWFFDTENNPSNRFHLLTPENREAVRKARVSLREAAWRFFRFARNSTARLATRFTPNYNDSLYTMTEGVEERPFSVLDLIRGLQN